MNMELWDLAVKAHGHECAGLAYGFRMGEEVKKIFKPTEKLYVIMPGYNCIADGISITTGISISNGTMKVDKNVDKYIFYAEGDEEGWSFTTHKLQMAEGADPVTGILAFSREMLFDISPCDIDIHTES
jgi:formylmethanofuran dehydrogenase subunit E